MNILKEGSKGRTVRILQRYLGVPDDGSFGPKTAAALKSYQRAHGLLSDGIAGPQTWLQLISGDLSPQLTDADYIRAAIELGVDLEAIMAIRTVESGGKAFDSQGNPVMLFEGHIFWKQLKARGLNPQDYQKGNENILYQGWTKKYYTGKNSGEVERLRKALKIHPEAAYESASYGLFQIMGMNYKSCGYGSASEFYEALEESEDNHLRAFVKFLKATGIQKPLQEKNWKEVARRYNGPAYAQNQYDKKLQEAYKKFL